MKIIADENIPFLKGVLEPYADVIYKRGESIAKEDILNADALIIRTRTKCDSNLLDGTSVRFIATATIGSDHIDLNYCRENFVTIAVASGCNAWGVVQYVLGVINLLKPMDENIPNELTAGIIGAGNVGERLAYILEKFGYRVLRCDPPVKNKISLGEFPPVLGPSPVDRTKLTADNFYDIEEVFKLSDIISVHLPLQADTKNYIGYRFLGLAKGKTLFINSSRGEVIDEDSFISNRKNIDKLVLDVWDSEPVINKKLLSITDIATPHIAGYSLEGKINATVMSVRALASYFGIEALKDFSIDPPEYPCRPKTYKGYQSLQVILEESFPVMKEDKKLREDPDSFEKQRSNYILRREIPKEVYLNIAAGIKTIP